ncbi:MAG: glycosyltransferase [Clostridia bacterium]|nr:glycosyltransferase [Clostridia bacterium]
MNDRCTAEIIPALNLPFFKQTGHARGAARLLKKWLKENEGEADKCVLVYGIYPAVVKKLQQVCHKHGCKIFALVTDVPSTMFTYTKSKNPLKKMFSGSYRQMAVELQDKFDGYVYLTEAMKDEVAPGKPYMVMETIADTKIFDAIAPIPKSTPPAVMYAGALYKKYGVDMIIEAFERIQVDCELWLFGAGDYEQEIKSKALYNPKIKFFGRVSREEVLQKEKEASLLLNIRNSQDAYTKYSFPSKMVEYMLSATPVLTTKLPGIPDEYDSYCYVTLDREPQKIADMIAEILSSGKMAEIGERARDFVINNKNSTVQTARMMEFLDKQIK